MPFFPKATSPFPLIFLFLFIATAGVWGKELEFAEYNCAFTLPPGWQPMTNLMKGTTVAAFASPGKTRMFMLLVDEQAANAPLEERTISKFDEGLERKGGGKGISGRFIQVGGIKTYERLGYLDGQRSRASTLCRFVPTSSAMYGLMAMRFDGKANEDPELTGCLESFRFIRRPEPALLWPQRFAIRCGTILRKGWDFVALVVFAVLVIVGITHRRKRKASMPPPLP